MVPKPTSGDPVADAKEKTEVGAILRFPRDIDLTQTTAGGWDCGEDLRKHGSMSYEERELEESGRNSG